MVHRRDDREDVGLLNPGVGPQPAHTNELSHSDVEDLMIERVRDKAQKCGGYDVPHPIWLLLHNPNVGIEEPVGAPPGIAALAEPHFERVLLSNVPMATLDVSPPFPRIVQLYAAEGFEQVGEPFWDKERARLSGEQTPREE